MHAIFEGPDVGVHSKGVECIVRSVSSQRVLHRQLHVRLPCTRCESVTWVHEMLVSYGRKHAALRYVLLEGGREGKGREGKGVFIPEQNHTSPKVRSVATAAVVFVPLIHMTQTIFDNVGA